MCDPNRDGGRQLDNRRQQVIRKGRGNMGHMYTGRALRGDYRQDNRRGFRWSGHDGGRGGGED